MFIAQVEVAMGSGQTWRFVITRIASAFEQGGKTQAA